MKVKGDFILKEVIGNFVVVPTGENLVDFKFMITLNDTGAFLWDALKEEKTFDELVTTLLEEYDTDEETAKSDVTDFVKILTDNKLLVA